MCVWVQKAVYLAIKGYLCDNGGSNLGERVLENPTIYFGILIKESF